MLLLFVKLSTKHNLLTQNIWNVYGKHISLHRNQQTKTLNTYIMKTLTTSTQKLFTRGQLVGIISVALVLATLAVLWLTGNFHNFGGTY